MSLALVSHAASSDRCHIWVGIADVTPPPPLVWQLDGQNAVPKALRPLAPVVDTPADAPVFSGFFEFAGLTPDSRHRIELSAGAERIIRTVQTLPATVPDGPDRHFDVLLLSCFHRAEDKSNAGRVLTQLKIKPHLTLFAGDQVYLDLPTTQNFDDDEAWLCNKFQNDYLDNWFGDRHSRADPEAGPPGYPQVLRLAPAAFMPDDHEYWNNYPFAASVVQNSWSENGRKSWTRAAEALYGGFQQTGALKAGAANIIEVEPLSILMLDTRSQRSKGSREKRGDLLGTAGRQALRSWTSSLIAAASSATRMFPMLVTGQSFFRSKAGAKGAIVDYEFPDYTDDYEFMVGEVERLSRAGLPVILATGDVHWGRVLVARSADGSAPIYEVISSPTSLVSSVGIDQASAVWGKIKGWFGKSDPWPKHSEPDRPPDKFGSINQYRTEVLAGLRGNQAFVLRFARAGGGLDVRVIGYPLSSDDTLNTTEQFEVRLQLRPTAIP